MKEYNSTRDIAKVAAAYQALVAACPNAVENRGANGVIDCSICGEKQLRYNRKKSNGRMVWICTNGCLRGVE